MLSATSLPSNTEPTLLHATDNSACLAAEPGRVQVEGKRSAGLHDHAATQNRSAWLPDPRRVSVAVSGVLLAASSRRAGETFGEVGFETDDLVGLLYGAGAWFRGRNAPIGRSWLARDLEGDILAFHPSGCRASGSGDVISPSPEAYGHPLLRSRSSHPPDRHPQAARITIDRG